MNVKNVVLGIGIFIVYMLMIGYGIEAFYPSPKYDAYCNSSVFNSPFVGKELGNSNCTYPTGLAQQEQLCYSDGGQPVYLYNTQGCISGIKECNMCGKIYNEARLDHAKVVFVIALILGIITLFVGYSILSVEPVGSALMASGIGAVFYGSVRNWENLGSILRFLLLVVALVLLIWLALRLNNPKRKK